MRFAYLLPLGACEHHYCTSKGLEVLRDHTNRVCGVRPLCTGGNKAHDVLAGILIVKTAGSIQERLAGRHVGGSLAHGEGPRLSTELPYWELGPCKGILARGSNEDYGGSLRASRYFGKNIGVVDGSLHISTLLFSFRIYIVCITPSCGRDSNILAKP